MDSTLSADRPLGPDGADEWETTAWEALAEADIPALLMLLVHATGDRRWLEAPFRPTAGTAPFTSPDGGLTPAAQDEVRTATLDVLRRAEQGEMVSPEPPDGLVDDMMSACVGESVGSEYGPMVLDQTGLRPLRVEWRNPPPAARLRGFQVVVIGAGLSGLCAAFHLARLGIRFTVLEKNRSVGGTWLENVYPGCRVDVPNHFYSYSFAPNPDWPEYFSRQPDILTYLDAFARQHDLDAHIRFGTEVESARFDERRRSWELRVRTGGTPQTLWAQAIITAVGQLNRPKMPAIPGLERFPGPVLHTARWDPSIDLAGRRVAVIGTGASAMQLVPAIAPVAGHVTVFQRTPHWSIPNRDYRRPVTPAHRWLLRTAPVYRAWYRFGLMWRLSDRQLADLEVDPDWPYPDRSVNANNDRLRAALTRHIERRLAGRDDLLAKCVPDYPPFSKRLLIDNGWYDTLRRDNVGLVTDPIVEVDGATIRTSQDQRSFDLIACATGFHATRLLAPMTIVGRAGRILSEVWHDDDPRAYLGIAAPDFPNLFFLYGPSTNMGHGGSIFFQAECQTRYVMLCLRELLERGSRAMECAPEAFAAYNQRLDKAMDRLIWSRTKVDTWYVNRRGRPVANSPWRIVDYWRMTSVFDPDHWIFTGSPQP